MKKQIHEEINDLKGDVIDLMIHIQQHNKMINWSVILCVIFGMLTITAVILMNMFPTGVLGGTIAIISGTFMFTSNLSDIIHIKKQISELNIECEQIRIQIEKLKTDLEIENRKDN